jgi:hypothetical protein
MEQSSQDYFMTPFHTENLTGSLVADFADAGVDDSGSHLKPPVLWIWLRVAQGFDHGWHVRFAVTMRGHYLARFECRDDC